MTHQETDTQVLIGKMTRRADIPLSVKMVWKHPPPNTPV